MSKLTDEEIKTINSIMNKLGIDSMQENLNLMESLICDGYKKVFELSQTYKSDDDIKSAASLLKDILFFEYLAFKRIAPNEADKALKTYKDFDVDDTNGFLQHAPKLESVIAAIEKQMSEQKIN